MMMPSIFRESLFDDLMNMGDSLFSKRDNNLMKTDIQEKGGFYHLDMELPGFKKEDITAALQDGYLTISAKHSEERNDSGQNHKYVRQERYYGACQRSFYVGEGVKTEDMKAKFDNGILHLEFPKADQKQVEENHRIAIEG